MRCLRASAGSPCPLWRGARCLWRVVWKIRPLNDAAVEMGVRWRRANFDED